MKGFIVAPLHNKPDRHDATGAFQLGARIFQRVHKLPKPLFFDNSGTASAIRDRVLKAIAAQPGGLDVFAYFGHGGSTCLGSAELYKKAGAKLLADALRAKANRGLVVLLYACNAGAPNGFASWLADELAGLNARVYGHLPPGGHSFTNPRMVVYPGSKPGGDMVIETGSPLWSAWFAALKCSETVDLWARFPFMTRAELEAELLAPGGLLGRWEVKSGHSTWHNVFFADQTILFTRGDSERYTILDQGKWMVSGPHLKITWSAGNVDRWPLPLGFGKQTVAPEKGGKKFQAKRIGSPIEDPRSHFYLRGPLGKAVPA
jgi:hypothetical protein